MGSIASVRLFGSHARGDAGESSDLDILCVLDRVTPQNKSAASTLIYGAFGSDASLTFYGRRGLRKMFEDGHLFAWHIFTESRFLPGLVNQDWILHLGKPRPYTYALQDIRNLAEIMSSIPRTLKRCPANVVYEAGLLFLCLRNIAISLSWYSANGLNFSRLAPFHVTPPFLVPPIHLSRYESYLRCRLASTRGLPSEEPEPEAVQEDANFCVGWCAKNIERLLAK
jgi:Nucleotidyltransferase domain